MIEMQPSLLKTFKIKYKFYYHTITRMLFERSQLLVSETSEPSPSPSSNDTSSNDGADQEDDGHHHDDEEQTDTNDVDHGTDGTDLGNPVEPIDDEEEDDEEDDEDDDNMDDRERVLNSEDGVRILQIW
eukprot:CAMPEP_0117418730 /NCGR_PEP_ID=MMETSP0758-20121206/446_1 /TAXON_ID=63605 /ORGANISM="Percolomonas cosmopolitus, Strain AE-1 (ATCC 50343)" /LENGTH=128 /DNA_ID=CAMNT_0005199395 /DNA_START=35 /DNA_END=418 /DNA_ORIENTATION=+